MTISDENVHKIMIFDNIEDCVYDMETESHDFNCGFLLIVHNSDSFVFNVNT